MKHILLSGVGGSTNWLPLIFPLFGILLVLFALDIILKFLKRRRLIRQQRQEQEGTGSVTEQTEAFT